MIDPYFVRKVLSFWLCLLLFGLSEPRDAIAQADECANSREYLLGAFEDLSNTCKEVLQKPIEYCSARNLTDDELTGMRFEVDFGHFYLVPPWPQEKQIGIIMADLMRTSASSYEDGTGAGELFFLLYSKLISTLIYDYLKPDQSSAASELFPYKELEMRFFPFGVSQNQEDLQKAIECSVRCGSKATSMTHLTRSKVFQNCIGVE
nr:hypothetical protein [uncultured Shimia sp.]